MADVKFKSYKDDVLKEKQRRVQLALELIGAECERYAKKRCPVDTGRLRNSITYATKDNCGGKYHYTDDHGEAYTMDVGTVTDESTVYIGTSVEYARAQEWHEEFQHTTGHAHFLRDALTQHTDRYKQIANGALSDD